MGDAQHKAGQDEAGFLRFRADLDAQFRNALMAYFGRRVNSRSEAEDLTQEVFVRLLSLARVPVADSVRAYIFTIAANLLRDRARRAVARAAGAHEPIDDANHGMLLDQLGPERIHLGQEALEQALNAVAELGETTRDIFILFRLEQMSQREIAALFGRSVSTIEKHIIKAMSHLGARFLADHRTNGCRD